MRSIFLAVARVCCAATFIFTLLSCTGGADFISVRDGQLVRGDSVYRFVGTNFWYGPILASEGQGGNRARLSAELDSLQALGIDNLRILVGAEGATRKQSLVWPTLQPEPGVYNDTLLAGLDWLLKEMGERRMAAVLYLNNSWEWSGGYGQYLEWAGEGTALDPTLDGYDNYCDYVSHFATNRKAQELFFNHVRAIVSRTNRYTGRRYADDATIMAWQVGNEPRSFARDSLTKAGFAAWIAEAAALIKQLDGQHLVSVGSEGSVGCEMDMQLYEQLHADPNIDYLTLHIWPMNWGWLRRDEMRADTLGTDAAKMQKSLAHTADYLHQHLAVAERLCKPLVIEEFGYARDGLRFGSHGTTRARDHYYKYILSLMQPDALPARERRLLAGVNFWAWSGMARPCHVRWQPFDDYCGDPAQEEQGLYSVFLSDSTTIQLFRNIIK